jgi:hypothetical protein
MSSRAKFVPSLLCSREVSTVGEGWAISNYMAMTYIIYVIDPITARTGMRFHESTIRLLSINRLENEGAIR